MPRPVSGRRARNLGNKIPKLADGPVETEPASDGEHDQDLAARLERIVGTSLRQISPSVNDISEWSQVITNATHSRFEHRLLVGIAVSAMKPDYGGITQQQERVADVLGRTSRWVRETVRVADLILTAIDEGLTLPLAMRDLGWIKVPGAIENIRQGHPLDFNPKRVEVEPTPEERAQAVAKALTALTEALESVRSSTPRVALATEAIASLQPYTEADADAEPEPEPEPANESLPEPDPREPEIWRPEPDTREPELRDPEADSNPEPASRDPSQPRRPGRNRPGRGPRRRR